MSKTFNLRLVELYDAVQAAAKAQGVSMNEWITLAVLQRLGRSR